MQNANRWIPLLLAALLAGGCSSQFQKEWRAAAADSGAAPDDHLAGRWKGSWRSDKSGHSGGLRCVAVKTGEDTYLAKFNATYGLVFRFDYRMSMTADVRDDETHVTGEQDLGKSFGGVYEYEGTSDGKTFRLNYRTKKDYGHFTLKRR
jgi:hypothetical protein